MEDIIFPFIGYITYRFNILRDFKSKLTKYYIGFHKKLWLKKPVTQYRNLKISHDFEMSCFRKTTFINSTENKFFKKTNTLNLRKKDFF